jgi:cellulose synthase/poly-beta-1,6-N-acetylglucosamine synthase-like glycosyltransferase
VDDYPTFNLLVRRSALEETGGFQSPYWPGEDTVLCLKLTRDLGGKIIYDPETRVFHHRRPLLLAHLRQFGNYGLHRGYFVKKFPETSRRFNYFLPSLWTLFLLLGWLPLLFLPGGSAFYLAVAGLYLLAAFVTGARGGGLRMTVWVMAGIIATHVVYGLNFIRGLLVAKLPEEIDQQRGESDEGKAR